MMPPSLSLPAQPRAAFVPLGVKLTLPVVALVVATALGVYWGLVRQERLTLLHSKEVAADMVVKLAAASIMPAVVFNDEAEIQRTVDDLARIPEVTDVELWTTPTAQTEPTKPLASFHRNGQPPRAPLSREAGRHVVTDEAVYVTESTTDAAGKYTGVIAVRFSNDREAAALALLARQSLMVAVAVALALACAILLTIGRLVITPLRRLQREARRLARGEPRSGELRERRGIVDDEVRQLAGTFAQMADAVVDREEKLAVRNAELKLILDSVEQGFLTANRDGTLRAQRSAIIETWFSGLPNDATLFDLVERIDPRARTWVEAAWDQVIDGILPLEVTLDQLPHQLSRNGVHFAFAYHPVMSGEQLEQLVVVLSDVTAAVERERATAEQREFSVLVDQFVRDRRAFVDFWNEASQLVGSILDPEATCSRGLRRDLHTLKGSSRFFGLARLSSLMHQFEDSLVERRSESLLDAERQQLHELWHGLERRIEPLTRGASAFLEVSQEEHERLCQAVSAGVPHAELERLVRGLRYEPTSRRLERAKEMLLAACKKLGKPTPDVHIQHNDLRLPSGPWAPLWSILTHILHNAADHGVESTADRAAAGKSGNTAVWLSTAVDRGELVVEVRDDGRGIDWSRVREVARAHQLPYLTSEHLQAALLHEGLSTRQAATDLSGRGVGLAAVRGVVEALNGRIELSSQANAGTSWMFRFPLGPSDEIALGMAPRRRSSVPPAPAVG